MDRMCGEMNEDIDRIVDWYSEHEMILSREKTNFMNIDTKKGVKKYNQMKLLDIYFDSAFNFQYHISAVIKM